MFKQTYSAKAKETDDKQNWAKPNSHPEPDVEAGKKKLHENSQKPRPRTANKFSSFHNQFKEKKTTFEKMRQSADAPPSEMRPMFSSFHQSGAFKPPAGVTPKGAVKVTKPMVPKHNILKNKDQILDDTESY